GASPADLAARRVWDEMAAEVRLYPFDLLASDDATKEVSVPRTLTVTTQRPLFDAGVIRIADGKSVDLGSWERVRYAAMLLAIGFSSPLTIVRDAVRAGAILDAFDADVARFRIRAKEVAASYVSERAGDGVVQAAERLWMRTCRARGMRAPA